MRRTSRSELLGSFPEEDRAAWASDIDDLRIFLAAEFARYMRYWLYEDGHRVQRFQEIVCMFLQGSIPRWQRRKKVLLGFRGSAKTYLLRRYVEWRWLRMPWTQFVVHSSTDQLAGQFTTAVRNTVSQSPIFEHLDVAAGAGSLSFSFRSHRPEKGESIRCAGINTSITGQRAHVYIFDDPEPDVMPEAMHPRIHAAFEEAEMVLHPLDELWPDGVVPLPEQTNYVVVGQPHWTGTAYIPTPDPYDEDEDTIAHPLIDAVFLKIPAIRRVPLGTEGAIEHDSGAYAEISMMPDRYTTNDLIHRRDNRVISRARWRLQMDIDCSPIEGEASVIPVTKLVKVHHDLRELTNLTMVVDPADSETACEWGVVVGGLYQGTMHVIDMFGFRGQAYDAEDGSIAGERIWEEIFTYCNDMGVKAIYLEKNLRAARIAAQRMLSRFKVSGTVFEYHATSNKLRRIIDSLEHPMNAGMITFESHVLDNRFNFRQLSDLRQTSLPKPCDRLDALAGLATIFIELPGVRSVRQGAIRMMNTKMQTRPPTFAGLRAESTFACLQRYG